MRSREASTSQSSASSAARHVAGFAAGTKARSAVRFASRIASWRACACFSIILIAPRASGSPSLCREYSIASASARTEAKEGEVATRAGPAPKSSPKMGAARPRSDDDSVKAAGNILRAAASLVASLAPHAAEFRCLPRVEQRSQSVYDAL